MISLPIWIRHLGVLTYEDSACTDENVSDYVMTIDDPYVEGICRADCRKTEDGAYRAV